MTLTQKLSSKNDFDNYVKKLKKDGIIDQNYSENLNDESGLSNSRYPLGEKTKEKELYEKIIVQKTNGIQNEDYFSFLLKNIKRTYSKLKITCFKNHESNKNYNWSQKNVCEIILFEKEMNPKYNSNTDLVSKKNNSEK